MEKRFTTIVVIAALIVLASYASGQVEWYKFGHSWDEIYCSSCIKMGDVVQTQVVTVPYLLDRMGNYPTWDEMDQIINDAIEQAMG